jgi:hypothetical protein
VHVEDAVLQMGAVALQSALVAQPTQRFAALHTGVGAEQSALVRQATHRFETVSHLGVVAEVQSPFASQPTHDPAFIPEVAQAGPPGLPAQLALVVHGPHVCVVALHTGVVPPQSVLNSQPTHVPVGKSQIAVPPPQAIELVEVHWPHAPQTSQAGVAGVEAQSASDPQALQTPPLHTGVSPPQSAFVRHWAHVFVARLHRGVAGGQSASAMQVTQVPRLALPVRLSQYGVAPPQSAFELQARHVSEVASQMGVAPPQLALVRQPTHVLVAALQTGVRPVHAVWLVAEHTAQIPAEPQAGVAGTLLHAGSPSQEHGMPLVLSSSS